MSFFTNAIDVLQTLVIALGGGLCVWGGINLLEGYGQDNPAAKSQGVKQFMAIICSPVKKQTAKSSALKTTPARRISVPV